MIHGLQHLLASPTALALATVISTADGQGRGRVEIMPLGVSMTFWASCVVASAGQNYGAALLPKSGEVVLVAFLTPDQPFVLGSVWQGANSAPSDETPVDQRYVISTQGGTKMIFDDNASSVTVATPNGNTIVLTDTSDAVTVTVGKQNSSTTIQATPGNVTITASSAVQVNAASVTVKAPSVSVEAAVSQFSGVVKCETLVANTVVGAAYTPGAGQIW
jgi:uncharacterized protein involved in type VI secretion and phage assembly